MKLLDLILGPRCADCGTRIKGEKTILPEKQVLCRPCKGTRDAVRKAADQERLEAERRSQIAEQERCDAESRSQMKARFAKYFEVIDQRLATAPPEAQGALKYKFLRATIAELRHLSRIQTSREDARVLNELLRLGLIDKDGSDLFLLSMIFEGYVENRIDHVEPLMAINPGGMGRNFIALFTATNLMSILIQDDPTGQRIEKLYAVFGAIGRVLNQVGPYCSKADLYQEIAARPSELFDSIFEAPGLEATELTSEQREKQTLALDHYLHYFERIPSFIPVFDIIRAIERASCMHARDYLASAYGSGPVDMKEWIYKAELAVRNVSIEHVREEAEKQKRDANQIFDKFARQATAEVAAEMRKTISQKLIQSLLVFAQQG